MGAVIEVVVELPPCEESRHDAGAVAAMGQEEVDRYYCRRQRKCTGSGHSSRQLEEAHRYSFVARSSKHCHCHCHCRGLEMADLATRSATGSWRNDNSGYCGSSLQTIYSIGSYPARVMI